MNREKNKFNREKNKFIEKNREKKIKKKSKIQKAQLFTHFFDYFLEIKTS